MRPRSAPDLGIAYILDGSKHQVADGKEPFGTTTSTETQTQGSLWPCNEQNINVKVVDGRVYRGVFELTIKDVVVRTEGSVGLDQTVEMVAIVPILDKWVEKDKYLSSLKGQSIRIPVRGTLAAPRLDMRGLQDFSEEVDDSPTAKSALRRTKSARESPRAKITCKAN
ncbi:MAG: hypothetical protein U0894_03360 [Pirellulales bacterium]